MSFESLVSVLHKLFLDFSFVSIGFNEIFFVLGFIVLASILLLTIRLGQVYTLAFVAVCSVLMNVFVVKPFEVFGLTTYGGNILYGCIFLANDMLVENFGKNAAIKSLKIGFGALLLYFLVSSFYLYLPTHLVIENALEIDLALKSIFSPALGIVVASILAFLISNTFNIWFYDFVRKIFREKFLWVRNNLSTMISQFLDTFVFTFIAIKFGFFSADIFWEILIFAYVFKFLIALLDTPFIYLSKFVVKKNSKLQ